MTAPFARRPRRARCGYWALSAVAVIAVAMPARAAADWEWTANQGWTLSAGAPQATPEAQMEYAYSLEYAGNLMDASRQYFLLLRTWPTAPDAGFALQRLGKCLFQLENYYASFKAINQVIQSYPDSASFDDLVLIELKIGQRLLDYRQAGIFASAEETQKQSLGQAIEIFQAVLAARPFGPSAPEAYLGLADAHFRLADYPKAREHYETALRHFSKQPEIAERARYGILQIEVMQGHADPERARAQREVVRGVMEDFKAQSAGGLDDDYDPIRQIDQAEREMNEKAAQDILDQARMYGRMGSRDATGGSLFLYGEVVRRFPDTPQADMAREKLGKIKVPREASQSSKFVKGLNPKHWNFFGRDEPPAFVVGAPAPAAPVEQSAPFFDDAQTPGGPAHAPFGEPPSAAARTVAVWDGYPVEPTSPGLGVSQAISPPNLLLPPPGSMPPVDAPPTNGALPPPPPPPPIRQGPPAATPIASVELDSGVDLINAPGVSGLPGVAVRAAGSTLAAPSSLDAEIDLTSVPGVVAPRTLLSKTGM